MSTEKGRIWVSTRNGGSGRVPEIEDPGEYREGKIQVSTGKGRIRASTENGGSGRVSERRNPGEYRKGKIRMSTEKGRIRASTVNGGIRVSTGKVGSGRVPGR